MPVLRMDVISFELDFKLVFAQRLGRVYFHKVWNLSFRILCDV